MEIDNKIPIRAVIYHVADGRTAVKAYANVAIGDYLSINSFSIAVSSYGNELVVYPPSVKCGNNKYKKIVEFPHWKEGRLKDVIDRLCIIAYKRYEDDHNTLGEYGEPAFVKISDLIRLEDNSRKETQDRAEEISLADIPF